MFHQALGAVKDFYKSLLVAVFKVASHDASKEITKVIPI
jgi:hypothetical protein